MDSSGGGSEYDSGFSTRERWHGERSEENQALVAELKSNLTAL